MIQRGGDGVIKMLPKVQQQTSQPILTATLAPGTKVRTEEDDSYAKLPAWGDGSPNFAFFRLAHALLETR